MRKGEPLPMVDCLWEDGRIKKVTVGPSAGGTIVKVLLVLAATGLLIGGVLRASDLTAAIPFLK